MLINRSIWICLLFLFIVSGCGVSKGKYNQIKDDLDTEQDAHKATKDDLDAEQDAHKATKDDLDTEQDAHKATKDDLDAEKVAHKATKDDLDAEQDAHKATKDDLDTEQDAHKATKDDLDAEQDAHKATKQKLRDAEKRYGELRKLESPTIEDYFILGQTFVEKVIKEKDFGTSDEMEKLFEKAIDYLRKVTEVNDREFSADAHYYIAKAYYYWQPPKFVEAHLEAKKAIKLKTRKLSEAQEIWRKTKGVYDEELKKTSKEDK